MYRIRSAVKGLAFPLVLLTVFSIFGITPAWAETVIVDKSFNGREIKVRAGASIRVDLEELGSAGYAWTIRNLDSEHFEVLSVDTRDVPAQDDITGAPVTRIWLFSTKKEGKAELKFLHFRPWEVIWYILQKSRRKQL